MVCFKGGTLKYGVSEVWAWRAHCLCTVRLQIACLHMVSLLPDFLMHFPLTPIQVLCSTSSLFLQCSFLCQASDKQVLQVNFCLQEHLFPSSSSQVSCPPSSGRKQTTGSGLQFLASPARASCLVPAPAPRLAFGGFMGLVSSLSTASLRFFSS